MGGPGVSCQVSGGQHHRKEARTERRPHLFAKDDLSCRRATRSVRAACSRARRPSSSSSSELSSKGSAAPVHATCPREQHSAAFTGAAAHACRTDLNARPSAPHVLTSPRLLPCHAPSSPSQAGPCVAPPRWGMLSRRRAGRMTRRESSRLVPSGVRTCVLCSSREPRMGRGPRWSLKAPRGLLLCDRDKRASGSSTIASVRALTRRARTWLTHRGTQGLPSPRDLPAPASCLPLTFLVKLCSILPRPALLNGHGITRTPALESKTVSA